MKIGGREVVLNERMIVPEGESVELDLRVGAAFIPIEIGFVDAPESANPVSWRSEGGRLKMTFSGFAGRGLGSVLRKPFKLGIVNGVKFGFTFALSNVSGSHLLDLVVMTGGDYDEQ